LHELKRAAKEYINDELSVDETAMPFMNMLLAYKDAEVAKHLLTPSVIDALVRSPKVLQQSCACSQVVLLHCILWDVHVCSCQTEAPDEKCFRWSLCKVHCKK
jgi:hypothetical protein